MAEFLIKAVDATHADPEKHARGCYKRGDIVCVMPDGHQWGRLEGLPNFVVLKIPGVSHIKAAAYMESHEDRTDPVNTVTLLRRKFRLRVDDVPAAIKRELRDTGSVTLSWSQVRGFLRNKQTNADESSTEEPR